MKKIKTYEGFSDGVDRISDYINNILKTGGKLAKEVWETTKREGEETKISLEILGRMIKGQEVLEKEKKFIRAHAGDLIRILPLIAIQGIPIPIPITPLLIILGKKYGFDFLPKDNRHLLDDNTKD
jgi:hypothetical protein